MSKVKPIIIKKNKLKTLKCMKVNMIKEDVIYRASPNDFLKGIYPNLIITNKLNKLNNSSRTQATFSSNDSSIVELTSDEVTQVIGQNNYDLVFTALCSVINQDLKIKAILSLLTTKKISNDVVNTNPKSGKYTVSTQTEQSSMTLLMKEKLRRNRKSRVAKPYVVTDQPNKVIIYPKNIKSEVSVKNNNMKESCEQDWPDLNLMNEELSNASWGSTSNLSILSDNIPNRVLDPQFVQMVNNIDKHTKYNLSNYETSTKSIDGSGSVLDEKQLNPENAAVNHTLTFNDTLQTISSRDKLKLIVQQALIDFKLCVQRDEDNNLPIHLAVLEDNPSMLKRQCIMLKKKGESLDEPAGNNLTALQMSIFHNSVQCMAVLLQHGADVFVTDDEGRTCFHLAAENDTDHLKLLLEHCKKYPRMVMEQNEKLWNAFSVRKNNENISEFLLRSICITCDMQGYTPLMLASKSGIVKNVKLLIDIAPDTINMKMPNCGNTALYLALAAACLDAEDRDDKTSVSPNYLETVETLVVKGGDPFLQNSSGSSVNDLLSLDSHNGQLKGGYRRDLCLLIANKLTSVKYFKGNNMSNFDKYMLVKNSQGEISIADIVESHNTITSEIQSSKEADTRQSNVVTSDDNNTAEMPVAESNPADASVVIAQNIPTVTVTQVTNVTPIDSSEKRKPTVRPIILKKNEAKPKPAIKYVIIPDVKGVAKVTVKPTVERVKADARLRLEEILSPKRDIKKTVGKDNTTSEVKNTATPKLITSKEPLKFVKILPKIYSSTNNVTKTLKRFTTDVKLASNQKVKRISVNSDS